MPSAWILVGSNLGIQKGLGSTCPSSREVLSDITSASCAHLPSPPFRQGCSESVLADSFSGVWQSAFIDFPELRRFTPSGNMTQRIYSKKGTSYFYHFLMLFYYYDITFRTMIIRKPPFIAFSLGCLCGGSRSIQRLSSVVFNSKWAQHGQSRCSRTEPGGRVGRSEYWL